MHQHIRHLTDIHELVTHRRDEAYASSLDFGKFYDRVNKTYIFRVSEKQTVDWVRLLY